MLIGSSRQQINTTQTDGTWLFGSSSGLSWGTLALLGTDGALSSINGAPVSPLQRLLVHLNNPWDGFYMTGVTSPLDGRAISAGTGVYVGQNALGLYGDHVNLGVKIDNFPNVSFP